MPKIKEVPSAEVHWQVASWNVRDAANTRIRQFMGQDADYFAPVYVTHSSYYWSVPDTDGWTKLTMTAEPDRVAALRLLDQLKQRALKNLPGKEAILQQVFSYPNEDFVFVRHRPGQDVEVKLTGWGFANFKRGTSGTIKDPTLDAKINEITVSFSIDGERVPARPFRRLQGTAWVDEVTDENGLFSFGQLPAGSTITVQDGPTGTERVTVLKEDTTNIDVDVTELVPFRVVCRHDGQPINGETAHLVYHKRQSVLPLQFGVSAGQLPWFEGEECTVTFRGNSQKKVLYKDSTNEFIFESTTPVIPRCNVLVRVSGDGAPRSAEPVSILTPNGVMNLLTDADGLVTTGFDIPENGFNIEVKVRDQAVVKNAIDGTVEFDFVFDTPPVINFDAIVRVVNADGMVLPNYPVILDLGDGAGTGAFLTNGEGAVGPFHMVGGNTMTVWDGSNQANSARYDLTPEIVEYVFELPYSDEPSLDDMSLRVVCLGNRPAAGATAILNQNGKRQVDTLNPAGQTLFGSDVFQVPGPMEVELYSPQRTFPRIPFTLEKDEKAYELVEVTGPQPWWHIAGEIALAGAALVALTGYFFVLMKVLWDIPVLF